MIEFFKMHGLGNDFVLLHKSQLPPNVDVSAFAKEISNRRTGIGCDQLILYSELGSDEYEMFIYNQDGSSAGACGNGTRCLTKLIGKKHIIINVQGRKLPAALNNDGSVTVNMGSVSFNESWMPSESTLWELSAFYKLDPREAICAFVGNPHLVIFKSDLSDADQALIGQALEHHPLFPGGINVNFAKVENGKIDLKVWERGDGFTLACGSGASASYAAAKKLGFVGNEGVVKFELGELNMSMQNDDVLMTGPAVFVAKGAYEYGTSNV
ncbi:MAG: diaminopimelate epimerase [Pseudomonadota bacterium]